MKYDDIRCPDCPSFKYCRLNGVMKGSSTCDNRRGKRDNKKSKRYKYMKEMLRR